MAEKICSMSEAELAEIAKEISEDKVTFRKYDKNGNSVEARRDGTPEEKRYIYEIAKSALLTCKWHRMDDMAVAGALDMAEFFINSAFPELNGYYTIYRPLKDYLNIL